jgi:hypothetical protein
VRPIGRTNTTAGQGRAVGNEVPPGGRQICRVHQLGVVAQAPSRRGDAGIPALRVLLVGWNFRVGRKFVDLGQRVGGLEIRQRGFEAPDNMLDGAAGLIRHQGRDGARVAGCFSGLDFNVRVARVEQREPDGHHFRAVAGAKKYSAFGFGGVQCCLRHRQLFGGGRADLFNQLWRDTGAGEQLFGNVGDLR